MGNLKGTAYRVVAVTPEGLITTKPESRPINIFLDMDGVLTDFLSSAIHALNLKYSRHHTVDEYATVCGHWNISKFYGITTDEFWDAINETPRFWADMKPLHWFRNLYSNLCMVGQVTILTTPSWDPICSKEKLEWLQLNMGIMSDHVLLGARKELLAGNGILIDDSPANVGKFRDAGGKAILVPSNWNTVGLTYEQVWESIEAGFFVTGNKVMEVEEKQHNKNIQ